MNDVRVEFGRALVKAHMSQMTALSRKAWPPIIERDGFQIVYDRAYQGFDARPDIGYPETRFWCRSIEVRRLSDGKTGWGIGPQRDAYDLAVRRIEEGVR